MGKGVVSGLRTPTFRHWFCLAPSETGNWYRLPTLPPKPSLRSIKPTAIVRNPWGDKMVKVLVGEAAFLRGRDLDPMTGRIFSLGLSPSDSSERTVDLPFAGQHRSPARGSNTIACWRWSLSRFGNSYKLISSQGQGPSHLEVEVFKRKRQCQCGYKLLAHNFPALKSGHLLSRCTSLNSSEAEARKMGVLETKQEGVTRRNIINGLDADVVSCMTAQSRCCPGSHSRRR